MDNSIKSRIHKLEQQSKAGNAGLLATILRRSNGEGGVAAAITSIEKERGRPLDAGFVQRAESISAKVQAMVRALFAVAP